MPADEKQGPPHHDRFGSTDVNHGAQQLTFFNAHYHCFCYLPMIGTLQFNSENEKYLFAAVLRPGNAHSSRGAIGILSRIISRVRAAFPKTRIRVRLDGGFGSPDILDYLDEEGVEYIVGYAPTRSCLQGQESNGYDACPFRHQ